MIVRSKEFYKRVAKNNKLDLSLVESIGNAMFQELRSKMEMGTSLAYEMPKLGTFSLRFLRFIKAFERYNKQIEAKTEWGLELLDKYADRMERDKIINKLVHEYRQIRLDAKAKRKAYKPSEDKPEEHKEISEGMDEIHSISPSEE